MATPNAYSDVPTMPDNLIEQLKAAVTQDIYKSSGRGVAGATIQTVLSQIDRYGVNPADLPREHVGLTFITRPKLNFSTQSLRQDRVMATLDTIDNQSLPFSIRAHLDTKWATSQNIAPLVAKCPFINSTLPFLTPLTNNLLSITGFPDFDIDTWTTEGGFFGEDQTIARGSDMNMKTYDFSLTFRDVTGGYVYAMMLYWVRYIALVTRGIMTAYPEDIYYRRLNYTCSIYRFVLDPYRKTITKWAKATGCFPRAMPTGSAFNIPDRENHIHALEQFTIPFTVNNVEASNDPIVFREFNTIVKRFAGDVSKDSERALTLTDISSNYTGIPYIDETGTNYLQFYAYPEESNSQTNAVLSQIQQQANTTISSFASNSNNTYDLQDSDLDF